MKLDCCTPFYPSSRGAALYHSGSCPVSPNVKVDPAELSKARHPSSQPKRENVVDMLTPAQRHRYEVLRGPSPQAATYGCDDENCLWCYGSPFDGPEVGEADD